MKALNKLMKALFYAGLALWILIQSYAIGLMAGGAFIAPVFAVWSAINKLPPAVTDRWWLIYLVSGIPVGIYALVYMVKHLIPRKLLGLHG
jgi:hypothetical protein